MRTLMTVHIPVQAGNKAVKDGSLGKIVGQFMEKYQPEAAYFAADGGERVAYFVFDMKDATDMPSVAEPFFLGLDARIIARPVMNAQDLKVGLEKLKI